MSANGSRRWRLSVDGQVEATDGLSAGTFTAQEWDAQDWPPCPVCGSTDAEPQRVDVRQITDRFPVFAMGAWECPNDCDPRPALSAHRVPRAKKPLPHPGGQAESR